MITDGTKICRRCGEPRQSCSLCGGTPDDLEDDENQLVETMLHFHGESLKAIKVSIRGNEEGAFWLPKSQIDIKKIVGGNVTFDWPEWLAKSRGLF